MGKGVWWAAGCCPDRTGRSLSPSPSRPRACSRPSRPEMEAAGEQDHGLLLVPVEEAADGAMAISPNTNFPSIVQTKEGLGQLAHTLRSPPLSLLSLSLSLSLSLFLSLSRSCALALSRSLALSLSLTLALSRSFQLPLLFRFVPLTRSPSPALRSDSEASRPAPHAR